MKHIPHTIVIGRKHWVAYVLPTLFFLIGVLMLMTSTSFWRFLGGIFIIINGYKLLVLYSVKWTLTSTFLLIEKGIFPWSKIELDIPIFQIYESLIYFGMMGHFLGFGHIRIRRTEGVTSEISETSIRGVKQLSAHINRLIIEYKANENTIPAQHSTKTSLLEDLQTLSALRDKGKITQEEYALLKQRIIDQI